MANIMQQLRLQNKPTKSGFDLSRSIKFTAKVGEATPVGPVRVVYPGTTNEFGLNSFTRTVNINTAAFARMREYYDFYFVPFEVLWNKFDTVITQMKDNVQHASSLFYGENEVLSLDLPYFTCQSFVTYLKNLINSEYDINVFGFKRSVQTVRLMSYLGYPDFSAYLDPEFTWEKYPMPNRMLSPFPLLAYQKAWSDHVRYSQWENANPSTFNLDYIKGSNDLEIDITNPRFIRELNFFDLRYFNYNKDMFMGLLPTQQYGDTSLVSVSAENVIYNLRNSLGDIPTPYGSVTFRKNLTNDRFGTIQVDSGEYYTDLNRLTFQDAKFSILALRQAEALQRWKEVSNSVDQDYKSQVEAHFGVKVSDYLAHKSTWINGYYGDLSINSVANTNLTGEFGADLKSYGTIGTKGTFTFNSNDRYGIIIALYHVSPIFDYTCGVTDPSVYLTHATDFPLPEFDRIGMEPVTAQDLCMAPYAANDDPSGVPNYPAHVGRFSKNNVILGYAPRYIKWKTTVDIALGGFQKKERNWVLPFDYEALLSAIRFYTNNSSIYLWSNTFIADSFRINPRVADTIFAQKADDGYDTDHFRVNCSMYCSSVQPLDYNGLSY